MKHNEYFRIKELILDFTPIDMDGQILYKFIFCLDDDNKSLRYDDIKIFVKSISDPGTINGATSVFSNDNNFTGYIELLDSSKKEQIIKILMKHPMTLDIIGQQMVITYQQKSLDNIIFGRNNTRQSTWQILG